MKIYLDFDGTVVRHEYPNIGVYNEHCKEVLQKLLKAGHEIVLNTTRAHFNDKSLPKAHNYVINLLGDYEGDFCIPYSNKKIDPPPFDMDAYMANSVIFIDDASEGVPLKNRSVDWTALDKIFNEKGIYNTK